MTSSNTREARAAIVRDYFTKMEVTLVFYKNASLLRLFSSAYQTQLGIHHCLSFEEWLTLTTAQKDQLIGEKVLISKHPDEPPTPYALWSSADRSYVERNGMIFTLCDKDGASNVEYILPAKADT